MSKSKEDWQLELADLFREAIDTPWVHLITKIKRLNRAYKKKVEFDKLFPEEAEAL